MEAEERPSASASAEDQTQPPTTTTPASLESIYSSISAYPFDTDTEFQAGLAAILGHPNEPATEEEKNTKPDLIIQAQCFYYARKFGITAPINPASYKTWLSTSRTTSQQPTTQTATKSSSDTTATTSATTLTSPSPPTPPPSSSSANSAPPPPPYPTSFAAIVELITNNKPIPGIEEIPDTILEHGSSKRDQATRRRKPWEKEDVNVTPAPAPSTRVVFEPEHPSSTTSVADEPTTNGDEESVTRLATQADDDDDVDVDAGNETPARVGVMHILSPHAVPSSGLVAKD